MSEVEHHRGREARVGLCINDTYYYHSIYIICQHLVCEVGHHCGREARVGLHAVGALRLWSRMGVGEMMTLDGVCRQTMGVR